MFRRTETERECSEGARQRGSLSLSLSDGEEERQSIREQRKRARERKRWRDLSLIGKLCKLPGSLKSTNTDPFAAWFVVNGDATPDAIRVVRR